MLELVYSNNATFLREKNIAGTTVVHFPNKLFRHKKKPFAKKYMALFPVRSLPAHGLPGEYVDILIS